MLRCKIRCCVTSPELLSVANGVSVAAVVTRCHTAKLAMAGRQLPGSLTRTLEGSIMMFVLRTVLFHWKQQPRDIDKLSVVRLFSSFIATSSDNK